MAPASATGGVAWENVIIVAESGGDYSSLVSAVSAAVSGDEILIAPIPALAENVTAKAGVSVISMSAFPDNIVLSPAAGVPLTIPSGGGSFLFHGLHFSPPSGQVAVVAASGATGGVSLHRCRLGVNGADSLDLSAADAALVVYARECTVDGNITTKAELTLYNCLVTGNVTQSTGAGDLTIDGGNIDGNLAHVTGSTITLRNLPRIGGTVSGAGTLVGAYLNSAGKMIIPVTGINAGILLGGDFQIYRSAANVGRTPDTLIVDLGMGVGTTSNGTGQVWASNAVIVEADGSSSGFIAGSLLDVLWYRGAANLWRTPDGLTVDLGLNIGSASSAATGEVRASAGFAARVDGSGGGFWAGASSDVQWFQGAANRWDTPDSVYLNGGTLGVGVVPDSGISGYFVNGTVASVHVVSDAGTTNVPAIFQIRHISSGTPAAGFGAAFTNLLHSDNNTLRTAAQVQNVWVVATDASRAARQLHYIYDSGGAREGFRIEASGTAPMIGFYGGAAAVKQAVTGSRGGNAALASLLTALSTIGLITDSSSA
jgi:hypothetical protein